MSKDLKYFTGEKIIKKDEYFKIPIDEKGQGFHFCK